MVGLKILADEDGRKSCLLQVSDQFCSCKCSKTPESESMIANRRISNCLDLCARFLNILGDLRNQNRFVSGIYKTDFDSLGFIIVVIDQSDSSPN